MDWQAIQFDWNRARAFLVAADEGSFSRAARALGTTQPTIGRQIAQLEAELEVALFERVANKLKLTEAGLELIDHVRAMSEAALKLSLSATGQSERIDGQIRIAASEAVSAFLLPAAIRQVRSEHPGIDIEIVASNSISDLHRREADIAIRNFRPSQPELFAKKLGEIHAYMYASPSYLDQIGHPTLPEHLSDAEILGFDHSEVMVEGLQKLGYPVSFDNFPIVTANHLVQWSLAQQGLGICIMMETVGDKDPMVQRVLPDAPGIPVPMWLTSHRELRTSKRIRVVFDLLAKSLTPQLAT